MAKKYIEGVPIRPRGRVLFSEHREYETWAFVPAETGRYIKTHRAALVTKCRECYAEPGKPCESTSDTPRRVFLVTCHKIRIKDFYQGIEADYQRDMQPQPQPQLKVHKTKGTRPRTTKRRGKGA